MHKIKPNCYFNNFKVQSCIETRSSFFTLRGRSQTTLTSFELFLTTQLPPSFEIFYLINVHKMSTFLDYLSIHLFLSTQFVNAPLGCLSSSTLGNINNGSKKQNIFVPVSFSLTALQFHLLLLLLERTVIHEFEYYCLYLISSKNTPRPSSFYSWFIKLQFILHSGIRYYF